MEMGRKNNSDKQKRWRWQAINMYNNNNNKYMKGQ